MEALPGIWSLSPLGGLVGIVILSYWLVSSGRLVPKSSHEREVNLLKDRGDEWKETAMTEREVNREIREQNSVLIESARDHAKLLSQAHVDVEDTVERNVAP